MDFIKDGVVNHLQWNGNSLRFLDQTLLPGKEEFVETSDYKVVCEAILRLAIRGAPAIGVAGGYAICLGSRKIKTEDIEYFLDELVKISKKIASVRPTAVNLSWALDRIIKSVKGMNSVVDVKDKIISEAEAIHREDIEMCRSLSFIGKVLLPESGKVMTYCNAGGLATGGYGTALGVIYAAYQGGKKINVIVNETRPLLQGARLTAWELKKAGIPFYLITDNMAAQLFAKGEIKCVVVGADRIALNGDTANKIGTYNLAVLAKYHGVPFYVAAPTSTIDINIGSGNGIPIENRNKSEVTQPFGKSIAPSNIEVMTPAFDITPSHMISAIITEKRICKAPYQEKFRSLIL